MGANNFRTAVFVAMILASSICTGQAYPHYETLAELEGSAATGPKLTAKVLSDVAQFCSSFDRTLEIFARNSVLMWNNRHAEYIKTSNHYWRRLESSAKNATDPEEREALELFLHDDYLRAVKSAYYITVQPIREAVSKYGASMALSKCRQYFEDVDRGMYDIKNRDLELASFLDYGIPRPPQSPKDR
ncbi:hypothetical protein [Cupriavidus sp. YR651]|uniref:hypothetical protein n=1 Tax=Cupriavidus sp. YR651 TaxID=1855315 RepID=UPI00116004B6|nr:hypothetical protein [Cupriavidus sp. YR651]